MRSICQRRPPTSCWKIDARLGFSCRAIRAHLLRPAWAPYGRSKVRTITSNLFTKRSWRTLPATSFQSIIATSATKAKVIIILFYFYLFFLQFNIFGLFFSPFLVISSLPPFFVCVSIIGPLSAHPVEMISQMNNASLSFAFQTKLTVFFSNYVHILLFKKEKTKMNNWGKMVWARGSRAAVVAAAYIP